MAKLLIAPTKSNLLNLRRQLEFAREGYELLEQKRQILVFELMNRLNRAREIEKEAALALAAAYEALRQATLDNGSAALDALALAAPTNQQVALAPQRLMGLGLAEAKAQVPAPTAQFGIHGSSAHADLAMRRFMELLPLIADLATIENAVLKLARELRKTQRRCNALSKIFIPDYEETIDHIAANLEERERESFVILKFIRERLSES